MRYIEAVERATRGRHGRRLDGHCKKTAARHAAGASGRHGHQRERRMPTEATPAPTPDIKDTPDYKKEWTSLDVV